MIVWGGWVVCTGVVLSYASGIIHPYYTVALAPGIAATVALAVSALWAVRDEVDRPAVARRGRRGRRAVVVRVARPRGRLDAVAALGRTAVRPRVAIVVVLPRCGRVARRPLAGDDAAHRADRVLAADRSDRAHRARCRRPARRARPASADAAAGRRQVPRRYGAGRRGAGRFRAARPAAFRRPARHRPHDTADAARHRHGPPGPPSGGAPGGEPAATAQAAVSAARTTVDTDLRPRSRRTRTTTTGSPRRSARTARPACSSRPASR